VWDTGGSAATRRNGGGQAERGASGGPGPGKNASLGVAGRCASRSSSHDQASGNDSPRQPTTAHETVRAVALLEAHLSRTAVEFVVLSLANTSRCSSASAAAPALTRPSRPAPVAAAAGRNCLEPAALDEPVVSVLRDTEPAGRLAQT